MTFAQNVKISFQRVKYDMQVFKNTMKDWILVINFNEKRLNDRLDRLESKIALLEEQVSLQKLA